MSREYHFWVYILSSRSRNLYVGMTNNLPDRTETHRQQIPGTHTARYTIHRLVYFEYFRYVRSAIAREKELKHWTVVSKTLTALPKNRAPREHSLLAGVVTPECRRSRND